MPTPSGGGIGRCPFPPLSPIGDISPSKGGEGRAWPAPGPNRPTASGRHPTLRPSPPPERSGERGPIRCQSGGNKASATERRSAPLPPAGSTPAATDGAHHNRRGCQWIPGSPAAPAAGDDVRGGGKAGVTPAVRRDDAQEGQGLCQQHMAARAAGAVPPSVPDRGHLPLKGERGACGRLPARTGRLHPDATPPSGRHPRRSAAQSGGPFVARAAATETRGLPAGPVRKRRRPHSRPLTAKDAMPAATRWDHHNRRGCQWAPGQAGDDSRGEGMGRRGTSGAEG